MILTFEFTLIGLLAALFGYALREYRDMIVPFFEITYVTQVGKRTDPVELDKTVAERLIGSFYIGELSIGPDAVVHANSGEIYDRWDRSDNLERFWPKIKDELEQLLTGSITQAEYLTKLSTIFQYRWFDRFIIAALENGRIQFTDFSEGHEIVEVNYDADHYGGSYRLFFPDGTKENFGENLNDISRRKSCEPFLNLIRFFRQDLLDKVFKEFMFIFDREYKIALSVISELKSIDEKHSRWVFKVYFANQSNTPIMIETDLTLEVKDRRDHLFLPCRLLTVKETTYDETNEPIVVGTKSSEVFGLITAKNRSEMGLMGSNLLKLYEISESPCRAVIKVRKAGFIKRQSIKSGFTRFTSTKKP